MQIRRNSHCRNSRNAEIFSVTFGQRKVAGIAYYCVFQHLFIVEKVFFMKNFACLHPAVNFIFYISAVAFGMFLKHPVFLVLSFFSAFTYNIVLTGKKTFKMLFLLYLPVVVFSAIINALTAHYGVTVLIERPGNNICLEPIIYGLVSGVSFSSVMMVFSCYNKTVSSDKLMFALGRKLPKTALIINMALRFVPLYSKKLTEIGAAQNGLKNGFEGKGLTHKIKNGSDMISSLISMALEGAIETADSMKSRGYGLSGRTHYNIYCFTLTDALLTVLLLVFDVIILIGILSGEAYVLYNPSFKINEITFFSIFIYAVYFMMLMTPVYIDIKERIKWKISESKI